MKQEVALNALDLQHLLGLRELHVGVLDDLDHVAPRVGEAEVAVRLEPRLDSPRDAPPQRSRPALCVTTVAASDRRAASTGAMVAMGMNSKTKLAALPVGERLRGFFPAVPMAAISRSIAAVAWITRWRSTSPGFPKAFPR